ncbi:hypothetical protein NPX13_g7084 [Xylaria arbuscula]|uniref:Uncharacterized protein n=1 Tax=Xylaria arbuscula TaxID=114810 RepID=A0A9W8TKS8_9PEZI|nr:hypothetical protein NPX13_g7084 [Xylaria arbuscula]
MHPLGHLDPALSAISGGPLLGIKMPGNGGDGGELRRSLDRHRTASYRLSCISEHQKENTRSSEDEYFSLSTRALKTPSLEPAHGLHRHPQIGGKSQRSSDGSTVSPLHLDSEAEGVCNLPAHHGRPPQFVLSTWQRGASIEIKGKTKQTDRGSENAVVTPKPPYLTPGVFEVQWQVIRWKDAHSGNIFIQEHRRTISGTGFDGPLSTNSGASSVPSPNDVSNTPLGPLSLANCMPCKTRKSKSGTSGSADWELNSGKGGDVSNSSGFDTPAHNFLISSPSTEAADSDAGPLKRGGQAEASQLRNAPESALKSCPDFYRRSYSVTRPSTTIFTLDTVKELKPPNYKQFDSSRHQHRHRIQNTVSKRYHSLRNRLRRGRSSSMFSVRPEFPPPPAGKVRRYRSRNSNEIWPSSEETPIFNTPESKNTPVQPSGQSAALLAGAGLRIATVELDRLTDYSRSAKSSLEVARQSSSSGESDLNESESSSIVDPTPAVPSNSPASFLSPLPMVSTTPVSRSWQGLRSRRQHSRLSEVTTPDEINTAAHTPEGSSAVSPVGTLTTYFTSKALEDALSEMESEGCETLMSEPLSILRSCPAHGASNPEPRSESAPVRTQLPFDSGESSIVTEDPVITSPASEGSSVALLHHHHILLSGKSKISEPEVSQRPLIASASLAAFTSEQNYKISLPTIIKRGIPAPQYPTYPEENQTETDTASSKKRASKKPCHPDTWSPEQGEPGDSDPFCPSDCMSSDRCGHESPE